MDSLLQQYILGFPDRDVWAPEPDVTIPDRSQWNRALAALSGAALTGRNGVVVTPVKPSGVISIGGEQHTVTAESGQFVDVGETVMVGGKRNGVLYVRPG